LEAADVKRLKDLEEEKDGSCHQKAINGADSRRASFASERACKIIGFPRSQFYYNSKRMIQGFVFLFKSQFSN